MAILAFIAHWNDFLGPLIYLNSRDNFTLALGLRYFQNSAGPGGEPMDHLLMAAVGHGHAALHPALLRRPALLRAGHRDDRDQGLSVRRDVPFVGGAISCCAAEAWRRPGAAYDAGQFGMSHGQEMEDRVTVGTALLPGMPCSARATPNSVAVAVTWIIEEVMRTQERQSAGTPTAAIGRGVERRDDRRPELGAVRPALAAAAARVQAALPADLRRPLPRRIRLALAEVERLNVSPIYTNIHLMCLLA